MRSGLDTDTDRLVQQITLVESGVRFTIPGGSLPCICSAYRTVLYEL
jgi:hypothetical protein